MLLEPEDSADSVNPYLAMVERTFIRRGLGVVSTAVTGRIVAGSIAEDSAAAARERLSVVERALALAKKSNADCILQVYTIESKNGTRYYLLRGSDFHEADQSEWQAAAGSRWRVTGPTLTLQAKAIDVETGRILAAIDLSQHATDSLPGPISRDIATVDGGLRADGEFRYDWPAEGAEPLFDQLAAEVLGPR